jgi:uncharacterized protein
MKINISELQNTPDQQLEISFSEKIAELDNDAPVQAQLTLKATSVGINIVGHASSDLTLVCDRCLKNYIYHIETDFNEDFVYDNIVPNDKKEFELKEGQFAQELDGKDEIDITDFLYQTIVLEMPIQKLCAEDCEGSEVYKKVISEKIIDERLEVFKRFSENNFNDN